MMNRVVLGPLNKIAEPMRGPEIAVIKELATCCEKVVPNCRFQRPTEHDINNGAGDDGVDGDLDRMLVERRQEFDPGRTMMDLMEDTPAKSARMAKAMPPIKDKGSDEP